MIPLHLAPSNIPQLSQVRVQANLLVPPLLVQTVRASFILLHARPRRSPFVVNIRPWHRPVSSMRIVQQPLLHSIRIEAIFDFRNAEVVVEHCDAGVAEEEAASILVASRAWVGVNASFHVLLG